MFSKLRQRYHLKKMYKYHAKGNLGKATFHACKWKLLFEEMLWPGRDDFKEEKEK